MSPTLPPHLHKPDVRSILAEALTADVNAVLADDGVPVAADAAAWSMGRTQAHKRRRKPACNNCFTTQGPRLAKDGCPDLSLTSSGNQARSS